MKEFYSIEENFEFLYNDIATLLTEGIVDSSLAENWLANWYVCNKYNTTRAIEYYAADLIIPKLKYAEIPPDVFRSVIDRKLNGCCESYSDVENTLEDKKYLINNINSSTINQKNFSYLLEDFENNEVILYIEENFFNDSFESKNLNVMNEDSKEILNIIAHIKHAVIENYNEKGKMKYLKCCNNSLLYKFKDIITEGSFHKEVGGIYKTLENLLNNQNDIVIEYAMSEITHINELIDHLVWGKVTRATKELNYQATIEQFDYLIEEIFFNDSDDDISLEQFIGLYIVTEALCEYESAMEASSRIITKGTEKITRAVGNVSARTTSGISKSNSKLGQLKRGAKIVDDRVSTAVNQGVDKVRNFNQDAKREKLIEGKSVFKLSRFLKTIIISIAAGKLVSAIPKQFIPLIPFTKIGFKVPLIKVAVTIIGIVTARALSKKTEATEKKRIMHELETELKITREKIDDAKGDNAREQKYQLMRIEAQLEKEILRIKHGLRPY